MAVPLPATSSSEAIIQLALSLMAQAVSRLAIRQASNSTASKRTPPSARAAFSWSRPIVSPSNSSSMISPFSAPVP